ncbi:MAG: DUF1499 domain-containing protein [Rhizobiaceae bacterium]|jgi:hypothetical protein|nr:DUF1499 domain-containing protein [Rhizobiaceae bacterium]
MRRTLVRRVSKSARFAQGTAFFSVMLLVLAGALFRFGRLDEITLSLTFIIAALIAGLAILFALAGLWKLWREGAKAGGASLRALVMAAITLAPFAFVGVQSFRFPAIYDVSTDLSNPPQFPVGAHRRVALPFVVEPPRSTAAIVQAQAYPDLASRVLDVGPAEAVAAIAAAARQLGWTPTMGAGGLDAPQGLLRAFEARTLLLGFTDDVVVRLLPAGESLVLDVRSASRFGQSDLGANAARIRAFMAALDAALAEQARI